MTANKTAATPENGKEKKPRGRKPRTARANTETTTGAGSRSGQNVISGIAPDQEDKAYITISGALRNLVDTEARVRVMRHIGERYGVIVSVQATGNTEQRSMAAGA